MIPMIAGAGWLYQVHRNRQYWLTKAERRRAMCLGAAIAVCVAISVLLWTMF